MIAVVISLLYSCSNTSSPTPPVVNHTDINFGNLQTGQKSYYVRWTGNDLMDTINNSIQYINDTLKVEIVSKDSLGFKLVESLTAGSLSKGTGLYADIPDTFYLNVVDDTLKMNKSNSSIIFGWNNVFPLQDFTTNEGKDYGWKNSLSWLSDTTGYVLNHKQFGNVYSRLNVIVKNKPMMVDGPGTTILYTKTAGLVRISQYGGFVAINGGRGWDLLN